MAHGIGCGVDGVHGVDGGDDVHGGDVGADVIVALAGNVEPGLQVCGSPCHH